MQVEPFNENCVKVICPECGQYHLMYPLEGRAFLLCSCGISAVLEGMTSIPLPKEKEES